MIIQNYKIRSINLYNNYNKPKNIPILPIFNQIHCNRTITKNYTYNKNNTQNKNRILINNKYRNYNKIYQHYVIN